MYYFYVLRFDKNGKLYYGYSNDLKRRIRDHKIEKSGFVYRNGNFKLIYYETYLDRKDAQESERYFKTGHGREILRSKLKNYFGGVA
jgi:putative endonuclease